MLDMICKSIGNLFGKGKGSVESYRKKAEEGDPEAQCNLGQCYASGHGVPENMEEAIEWYRKSAEQGYAPAQFYYGNYCYTIDDHTAAFQWWSKS
ncbi:MAG: sel1 repeat family protein, partial [Lentisphaeria bacterium]|nr:sel1 repeat family protein [Lentisphaeria bacterium]